MKKLLIILTLSVLTKFVQSQKYSTEVYNLPSLIQVQVKDSINREVGFFRFDSTSGTFIRRGNQTVVFREYIKFLHTDGELLTAAINVLKWIQPDGSIRYPVEFLQALGKWIIVKTKWGLL